MTIDFGIIDFNFIKTYPSTRLLVKISIIILNGNWKLFNLFKYYMGECNLYQKQPNTKKLYTYVILATSKN